LLWKKIFHPARAIMDREKATRENIGLVHACARRFLGRGADYDDLVQAGCEGLVKAADRFDENRGCCFSTYAVPVILGEMKKLFREGNTVKMGRTLQSLACKANRWSSSFAVKEGRQPTVSEVASGLGISSEEAAEALCAGQMPLSLTEENDEEGQLDLPTDSEEERITESMSLREALKDLPANDRKLVWFRYFQDQTQNQTAQRLGMTQVQVSRREKKILTELRQMLG